MKRLSILRPGHVARTLIMVLTCTLTPSLLMAMATTNPRTSSFNQAFAKTTDFMHARYYSPNLGRFMSVDPVGGSVGSSQSWNRYTYVENNPLAFIDPNGEANFGVLSHQNATRNMTGDQAAQFTEIQANVDQTVAVAMAPVAVGLALPAFLPASALGPAYVSGSIGAVSGGLQSVAAGGNASDVLNSTSAGAALGLVTGSLGGPGLMSQGLSASGGHVTGQVLTQGMDSVDNMTLVGAALAGTFAMTGGTLALATEASPLMTAVLVNGYQAMGEVSFSFAQANAAECPECNPSDPLNPPIPQIVEE